MKRRGLFITFEGTEGSGKGTQIRKTAAFLRRRGRRVAVFQEPGTTSTGREIRKLLLDRKQKKMTAHTELLLYLAARAQLVEEKIYPALKAGKIVLCDRFEDSTLAYQGWGRGLERRHMMKLSEWFVRGRLKPDLTVVLDLDPELGLKRGGRHDRMERQSMAFHRRVREGFRKLAARDRHRYVVIDSRREVNQVFEEIRERLDHVLG